MNYFLHIFIMIGIYTILALSINLLVGYTGLLSLAHAAFYGIGAYSYVLFMINFSLPWGISLILAVLFTAFIAFIISYPILRLRGDYFILGSIGFQIIIFDVLYNWTSLTEGPYGIAGIPKFSFWNSSLNSIHLNFLFILIFSGLIILFFKNVYSSPFGRILKSIREDETASKAIGKDTPKVKIWAFVVSGAIAAVAGAFYASYITYIDPTSFNLNESIFIITVVLVGGSGNLVGPIIGSVVLVTLPEILRFVGLPDTIAPNIRQMIYGFILIILMFFRPQGIKGEYKLD